jgi:hypothetical protein
MLLLLPLFNAYYDPFIFILLSISLSFVFFLWSALTLFDLGPNSGLSQDCTREHDTYLPSEYHVNAFAVARYYAFLRLPCNATIVGTLLEIHEKNPDYPSLRLAYPYLSKGRVGPYIFLLKKSLWRRSSPVLPVTTSFSTTYTSLHSAPISPQFLCFFPS